MAIDTDIADIADIAGEAPRAEDYPRSMDLGVLGPVIASRDGELLGLGGPRQRAVLALLVLHAGRPVSTEQLIDGIYGDEPPSGARRTVQTYVSNLRGVVGDVIVPHGSGYLLHAERDDIDLSESYAYSDSQTDLPMMEMVGHPVAVNPDKELRKVAEEREWPILEFQLEVSVIPRIPRPTPLVSGATVAVAIGAGVAYALLRRRSSG